MNPKKVVNAHMSDVVKVKVSPVEIGSMKTWSSRIDYGRAKKVMLTTKELSEVVGSSADPIEKKLVDAHNMTMGKLELPDVATVFGDFLAPGVDFDSSTCRRHGNDARIKDWTPRKGLEGHIVA